mmetsp:Transcript_18117/g.24927  ORF Transcript_18117/g.24927 Transcript_18117/m.24927 type:complete len:80 (+) Transcript_18117:149-388(+)
MPSKNGTRSRDEKNIIDHLHRSLGPPPASDHLFSTWGNNEETLSLQKCLVRNSKSQQQHGTIPLPLATSPRKFSGAKGA